MRCLLVTFAAFVGLALTSPASAQAPGPYVGSQPSLPPSNSLGAHPAYPMSLSSDQAHALMRLGGYLRSDEVPDSFHILPPAPRGASPGRQEDVAAYRETRKLKGGARWNLAAQDAVLTPFSLLDDEACAMGVQLDQTNAPTLVKLLTRSGRDASHIVDKAKDQFKQVRPFVAEGGPICTEDERVGIAKSYSYPSGHSTYSWAASLILAELAPEHATAILTRARAYGESRVVCGVHWVSDVEEGRTNASILVAVLHSNPQFLADLAEAKIEVADAYAARPPRLPAASILGQCAVVDLVAAHTPWTR